MLGFRDFSPLPDRCEYRLDPCVFASSVRTQGPPVTALPIGLRAIAAGIVLLRPERRAGRAREPSGAHYETAANCPSGRTVFCHAGRGGEGIAAGGGGSSVGDRPRRQACTLPLGMARRSPLLAHVPAASLLAIRRSFGAARTVTSVPSRSNA